VLDDSFCPIITSFYKENLKGRGLGYDDDDKNVVR
jgi:hypothetical protein